MTETKHQVHFSIHRASDRRTEAVDGHATIRVNPGPFGGVILHIQKKDGSWGEVSILVDDFRQIIREYNLEEAAFGEAMLSSIRRD